MELDWTMVGWRRRSSRRWRGSELLVGFEDGTRCDVDLSTVDIWNV